MDTRATKSTELASSAESAGDIGDVEDDASRMSGVEKDSCEYGKRSRKRGLRRGSEGDCYTRIEFELEGSGRLFRMSPSAFMAILTLSS